MSKLLKLTLVVIVSLLLLQQTFLSYRLSEAKIGNFSTIREKLIHFKLDPNRSHLLKIGRGFYLDVKGCEPSERSGYPLVPSRTFVIELPVNAEIVKISLTDCKFMEIKRKFSLAPSPPPLTWDWNLKEILQKLKSLKGFHQLLSYNIGSDGLRKFVILKLYPLQCLNGVKRILTECNIKIDYVLSGKEWEVGRRKIDCENVIITNPSLYDEACMLKAFHDKEGIKTTVLNTTWIYENYKEERDPPYAGYKDPNIEGWREIEENGYNYSLAKRIEAFLRDVKFHPNLKYVTIIGDAKLVPPSYYFFSKLSWIPTDFFYASPDFDMIPNYMVGRLPARNSWEALQMIEKIVRWNASSKLFERIAVAGGIPFGTPLYIGELICVDAINRGYFKGMKPYKLFETEGSFDKENLTRVLKGGFGLLYHIGHGNGKGLALERGILNGSDLLELPANNSLPIVISISCMNGAIDPYLLGFNLSFGEAVLLSNAGGIAYIGGTRANMGGPIVSIDEGRVEVLKESYMAGMLSYVLKWLSKDVDRLGGLTFNAMKDYVIHNDFSDPINNHTLFEFILLGDPALKLPIREKSKEGSKPVPKAESAYGKADYDCLISSYPKTPLKVSGFIPVEPIRESIPIHFETNSSSIRVKIIDCFKSKVTTKNFSLKERKRLNLSFENSSLHLVRGESEDGKEGWLYVAAALIVNSTYDEKVPGCHVSRWSSIKEAIKNLSYGGIVYVKKGTYKGGIILRSAGTIYLIGEGKKGTFIDGEGKEMTIVADSACVIAGFSIAGGSKAAISVEKAFHIKVINCSLHGKGTYGIYGIGSPFFFACVIEENSFKGFSTGIFLGNSISFCSNNEITGTRYAIYLSGGSSYLTLNRIIGNTYGIYAINIYYSDILYNNISSNTHGIYLEKSGKNFIAMNNFLGNHRHASFKNCKLNVWFANYWDNWVGLKFNTHIPKVILGRMGIVPWINLDRAPARKPYE